MNEFQTIGKYLILSGAVLLVIGVVLTFGDKLPLLGKLPGDIKIEGKNYTLYFPVVTSIIISLIISMILYFFKK
jgi:uncharacterized protein HemY